MESSSQTCTSLWEKALVSTHVLIPLHHERWIILYIFNWITFSGSVWQWDLTHTHIFEATLKEHTCDIHYIISNSNGLFNWTIVANSQGRKLYLHHVTKAKKNLNPKEDLDIFSSSYIVQGSTDCMQDIYSSLNFFKGGMSFPQRHLPMQGLPGNQGSKECTYVWLGF